MTAIKQDELTNFPRQWILLQKFDKFNYNWSECVLNSKYILYTHPDLDVTIIESKLGKYDKIIVLGIAVFPDENDLSFSDDLKNRIILSNGDVVGTIIELCGTYVVIAIYEDEAEIYTDPSGMRGVYYKDERAASTPLLLPDIERDSSIDSVFPFGKPDEWYPGDLCPYVDTKALLANHRLCLKAGTVNRFWPNKKIKKLDIETALNVTSKIMKGITKNITNRWVVVCSITGGMDSRVSLSACKDVVNKVKFFTLLSKKTVICDKKIPASLSSIFNIKHSFIEIAEPEDELIKQYDLMTAYMSIGERRRIVSACKTLGGKRILHLNGNLGAIAKSFYWHNKNPKRIDKNSIIREFAHKPKVVLDAIDSWFNSLPDLSATTAYNLMYLEQRGGRWMGIGETGSHLFYDSVTLFNSRKVFEAICGLQYSQMAEGFFLKELVRKMWPELLTVAYCPAKRKWSKILPLSLRLFLKKIIK